MRPAPTARPSYTARLVARTLHGERLGLEGYLWVAHRLSGVVLILYLFVHLLTLSTVLRGPEGFDAAMAAMHRPVVRLFEWVLVIVATYHALNGLRLFALHAAPGRLQRPLSYGVIVASVLVAALMLPVFF